ncbi:hypothetical protein EI427_17270 [Flammeovirga pectinis]|uniref:CBM-cenC domain-containing protein n=1 Tax=Flammeovirga pectinis TaxID=2494373 RepID=A0A3Q9FSX6_9BACT|nr:hypothetical protein [Flammeovirga pectinis]AZQ63911.1 hypothetical protein EI427_17270 [Flammeovirga pectinis]
MRTMTLLTIIQLAFISSIFAQGDFVYRAKNNLDESFFSFEEGVESWWTTDKEYWSITDEKKVTGSFSLKYSCDKVPEQKNIKIKSLPLLSIHKINIKAGVYNMYAKVWLGEQHPKSLLINITGDNGWASASMKFKKVETGKWIEVSQKITVNTVKNGNMVMSIPTSSTYGGPGLIYVDDIYLEKI